MLIVALLLCAVIGISLASYVALSNTALRLSNRGLYNNGAMNLAERALEEAMYSVNAMVADPTYDWGAAGWTLVSANARQKWTNTALSQNTTADYRAYIYNYAGINTPKVVARATVSLAGNASPPIEKWVEITLRRTSKFANGLVAKDSIVFNGNNTTVDSWNSDPDNNPATAPLHYSAATRNDNGTVGSISVSVSAVLVNNADIWGYVSTGGSDPTTSVGNNGSVLGEGSTYDPTTWTKTTVDPARVSTEFSHDFDDVSAPTKTIHGTTIVYAPVPSITESISLPASSGPYAATPADDGYYYYSADQIDLTNKVLTITDKVVLRLSNATSGIDVGGGSGAISITSTGECQVYTPGDVKIAGQGLSNGVDGADSGSDISDSEMGQPRQFQVFGTKTSGVQDIEIKGNGSLAAAVYAPYGSVKINGNGTVAGSVVANDITLTGNANFHYDESLALLSGNSPFRVTKWKELTSAADRAAVAATLAF